MADYSKDATEPGEPAFGHGNPAHGGDPGLTKREYFAAKAMQGILSNPEHVEDPYEDIAGDAVYAADALIEQLNK